MGIPWRRSTETIPQRRPGRLVAVTPRLRRGRSERQARRYKEKLLNAEVYSFEDLEILEYDDLLQIGLEDEDATRLLDMLIVTRGASAVARSPSSA